MKNTKRALSPMRQFWQDMARVVCAPLIPIFRLKTYTPDGKKLQAQIKGGAIIVANHTSLADPFLVGTAFWYRRVFFLTAKEVMDNPVKNFLLKGVGCIRIDRESTDLEAIKKAVGVLKAGRVLVVFPQGGIAHGEVDEIKSGAILLAMQAGVPIVPIHIGKRKAWYKTRPVVVGDVIDPAVICTKKIPSVKDIENVTARLFEEMIRCQEAMCFDTPASP